MPSSLSKLKFFFICVFLISYSVSPLSAKEKLIVGVKGNIGAANSTGLYLDSDFSFHYNLGGQVCYNLMPFLGVESGIQLYQTGWASRITYTDVAGQQIGSGFLSHYYTYLMAPLYMRIQLKGFYAAGGMNFAIPIAVRYTGYEDTPDNIISVNEGDVNVLNMELHLGLGYRAMLFHRAGIFLELGYNRQLLGLYENI